MDEVCITSVKLSLSIYTNESTCQASSYHVYLVARGRTIQPADTNLETFQYVFTGLSSSTRHDIQVTYRSAVNASIVTVPSGYTNTPAPQRKFLCTYLHFIDSAYTYIASW